MDRVLKYVLLGLAVRLALAPFFLHLWDVTTTLESTNQFLMGVNVYRYVVERTAEARHLSDLPVSYEGFAYLPSVLFFFAPFQWLYAKIFQVGYPIVNGHAGPPIFFYPQLYFFLLIIKMPIILADLMIIYLLTKREQKAGLLYALCPYAIAITAVWGNFDSLVGLLILASYISFEKSRFASGFLYGLSLMKIYAIAAFPAYLIKVYRSPRQLVQFSAGFVVALIPSLCYMLQDSKSMLGVFLFHSARQPGGVNLYNSAWFIEGIEAQLPITRIAILVFGVAVLLLSIMAVKRNLELRESILLLLMAYLVFGPVTNEQYLAAILPLALLSSTTRWGVFTISHIPLIYALFLSKYTYFTMPIFWSSDDLLRLWKILDTQWDRTIGLYRIHILYFLALSFAFSLTAAMRRCFTTAHRTIHGG